MDGCGLLSGVVNGDTTFHDLEIASASGRQVTFTAGSTQTVTGAFDVSGVSGNLLKIRSSVDGAQAFLNVQGTSSAGFVDVQDSNALSGNAIALGSESVKGPNTLGWLPTAAIPLLPPLMLAVLALSLVAFGRRALPR